jgi:protein phosphatase
VQRFHLNDGDQMLLCTDGLNGVVADAEIASTLRTAESADDACGALVDQALSAGGPDNITVVVARYRFPAQP